MKQKPLRLKNPFAGEEEREIETLLSKISTSGQDLDMSSFDDDVDARRIWATEPPPNWRENLRS